MHIHTENWIISQDLRLIDKNIHTYTHTYSIHIYISTAYLLLPVSVSDYQVSLAMERQTLVYPRVPQNQVSSSSVAHH